MRGIRWTWMAVWKAVGVGAVVTTALGSLFATLVYGILPRCSTSTPLPICAQQWYRDLLGGGANGLLYSVAILVGVCAFFVFLLQGPEGPELDELNRLERQHVSAEESKADLPTPLGDTRNAKFDPATLDEIRRLSAEGEAKLKDRSSKHSPREKDEP